MMTMIIILYCKWYVYLLLQIHNIFAFPNVELMLLLPMMMMVPTTVLRLMTIIKSSGFFDSGTNADDNIDDGANDGAEIDDNNNIKWFL